MENNLKTRDDLIDNSLRNSLSILSIHSRRQYSANIHAFESYRSGRPMTKTLVEAYAVELHESGLAPSTINHKLASIRWWAMKIIDYARENLPRDQADETERQAKRILEIQDLKGERIKPGRHIKGSEFVKLLRACFQDHSPAGARDAALFATAWTTGLRRSEILALTHADFRTHEEVNDDGSFQLFAELRVMGKGNKERIAYVMNGALEILMKWMEGRNTEDGFLFCPVRKSGYISVGYPLSGEALRKILKKRIDQAEIKDSVTWHDFRRTFAGMLLDENDLATVQALLGHASPITTSSYDRRPAKARIKAIKNLVLPKVETLLPQEM